MKAQWKKYQDVIYSLVLLAYPLTRINQGLSVIDTTYSLSNFLFFEEMKGTWMVATYLANLVGYVLMKLPFGSTVMGMNVYTSLVIGAMAVSTYHVLKRVFPKEMVFCTQLVAIGLCWAPTTVLYHYLTYMLLHFGVLLLYLSVVNDKSVYAYMAGVMLGLNLVVRMPNITQCMLIVVVWFGVLYHAKAEEKPWKICINRTGVCLLGYLSGAIPFLLVIGLQYGWTAYGEMVYTMFAMTEKATDYAPTSMLTGMLGAYLQSFAWMFPALLVWLVVFFARRNPWIESHILSKKWCKLLYLLFFLGLIRLYWGRGMFDFRYYQYRCVYGWNALFLLLAIGISLKVLCWPGALDQKKYRVLALLVLLEVFLVPLGGNNALYPLMNDLFLILPVTLGFMMLMWREKKQAYYLALPAALLCGMLMIQSVGFHCQFALQDGIWGEKRDTQISRDLLPQAAGIYTTKSNATGLEELVQYVESQKLGETELLLYGDVPGLGYFLQMPSALSTFWPSLDSYRVVEFKEDMKKLQAEQSIGQRKPPLVIVSNQIGEVIDGRMMGLEPFTEVEAADAQDEKLCGIIEYMQEQGYVCTFENHAYRVYQAEAAKGLTCDAFGGHAVE